MNLKLVITVVIVLSLAMAVEYTSLLKYGKLTTATITQIRQNEVVYKFKKGDRETSSTTMLRKGAVVGDKFYIIYSNTLADFSLLIWDDSLLTSSYEFPSFSEFNSIYYDNTKLGIIICILGYIFLLGFFLKKRFFPSSAKSS